ncbi:MAG TPA: hypothetical protein VFJ43_13750 [Bacteroidia bacterium]|nr:hypothetical protein [Bacteroidia bacterium]
MKNKFLLLSAALFIASTPMLAGSASNEFNSKNATITIDAKEIKAITLQEVQQYMAQFGFQIVQITTIDQSENVYAMDINGKNFIIYVVNGVPTGWDQVDF